MTTVAARRRRAVVLGLLVVGVVACGSDDGSSGPTSSALPLEGTPWVLTDSSALGPASAAAAVSAKFADGAMTGSSGCNSYRAPYTKRGAELSIGPDIAGTRMACPAGPTAVERAYLARLPRVRRYSVSGSRLVLLQGDGKALLTYRASGGAAALVGAWTVTSLFTGDAIESVATGSTLTADFAKDEVTGNGGCNGFRGPFEASEGSIRIGPVASTLMACEDAARGTQEQHYLDALELATTYAVRGDRLDLLRADGGIAVTFERTPSG